MSKVRSVRMPSPALIVAMLALIVAIGGAAHAANKAAKNTVVSKSVKNNALKGKDLKNASVTGTDVRDDSLTGADVDESTLSLAPSQGGATGAAGGDLAGTFPNPTIADGAVNSAKVANDSLGAGDLAPSSVGPSEIAANSVSSGKVLDGSIFSAEISEGTIVSGDVANESLTGTDIDNTTVTGADLAEGTVTSVDVANGSMTDSDIDESTLPFGRIGRDSSVNTFVADADIATKTINVPAGGGFVYVNATAQLESGPGDVGGALIECKLDINENDIPVTQRSISIDESNGAQCATNWAQSIGPGNQTFNLEVTSLDEDESASNPVLTVMFVPFNELGN